MQENRRGAERREKGKGEKGEESTSSCKTPPLRSANRSLSRAEIIL